MVVFHLDDSSGPRFSFSNDLLFLTVNDLQRNDSGVYNLRAGNPAGTSVDSIVLHVGGECIVITTTNHGLFVTKWQDLVK